MKGAPRARTVVIVSIGSGSVSVGLASLERGTVALLDSEERRLPLEERSVAHTVALLKRNLAEATQALIRRQMATGSSPVPEHVYCILRAPWTEAKVVHVAKKFDAEQLISDHVISALAHEALARSEVNENFIEASAMQFFLNGYPTPNPAGKRARHLALVALISRGQHHMRAAALEALAAVFPAHEPKVRSGTRVLLEAVSRPPVPTLNCVVVDVGEEGTAVLVIRDGAVEREVYAREGMRRIMMRANPAARADQVRAMLSLISRNEHAYETYARMRTDFARMEPELAHAFVSAFSASRAEARLPEEMVLRAPPALSDWLVRFFARPDFALFTTTSRPFRVRALTDDTAASRSSDISVAFPLINKEQAAE